MSFSSGIGLSSLNNISVKFLVGVISSDVVLKQDRFSWANIGQICPSVEAQTILQNDAC